MLNQLYGASIAWIFLLEKQLLGFKKLEASHCAEIDNSAFGCISAHHPPCESGKEKLFGGTIFIPHIKTMKWALFSLALSSSDTFFFLKSDSISLIPWAELEAKVALYTKNLLVFL